MVYREIIDKLVQEVGSQLGHTNFNLAFQNAPSFFKLCECEVDQARKEVASRLGRAKSKRKNTRRLFGALRETRRDTNVR